MYDATAFQASLQPLTKLTQSNVELLTRFAVSPEVTAQAINDAQRLFQQAQESAMKLSQSHAFGALMQGFMTNYIEFCTDLSQSAMAMVSHGQAALMQQATEATSNAVAATQSGARRLRAA